MKFFKAFTLKMICHFLPAAETSLCCFTRIIVICVQVAQFLKTYWTLEQDVRIIHRTRVSDHIDVLEGRVSHV